MKRIAAIILFLIPFVAGHEADVKEEGFSAFAHNLGFEPGVLLGLFTGGIVVLFVVGLLIKRIVGRDKKDLN